MASVEITTENIEEFRGELRITKGDLPYDIWALFDRAQYENSSAAFIVPLCNIVSRKNELLDPKFLTGEKVDPRANAFKLMVEAAKGNRPKRGPLLVHARTRTTFDIVDGNATAQALMLAGWVEVPVIVASGGALEQAT